MSVTLQKRQLFTNIPYIARKNKGPKMQPISLRLRSNFKIPMQQETPMCTPRDVLKVQQYFESKYTPVGSYSCDCETSGRYSKFKQKVFKLYPIFESKSAKRKRVLRKLKKYVIAVQFIIRYRIVQQIRARQKGKMKKFIRTTDKPLNVQNLINAAKKQIKLEKKDSQLIHQDSDEEFYHFPDKAALNRHKTLIKFQQMLSPKPKVKTASVYYMYEPNRQVSQYVSKRMSLSPQASTLPPLSSVVSHRKNLSFQQLRKT